MADVLFMTTKAGATKNTEVTQEGAPVEGLPSNLIVKQIKQKWYTEKVLFIVLVQMHFIQRK